LLWLLLAYRSHREALTPCFRSSFSKNYRFAKETIKPR